MFTREKQEMRRVPMMPVRDMVIFPQQMTPFIVGREASVRALEEALASDKKIFLSTQHDASVDDPKPEEIYAVGTLANIVQSVKLPDGNIKVLVEGVERARALSIATEEGFFRATIRLMGQRIEDSPQVKQMVEKVTGLYEQFIKLSQSLNYDTMIAAARGDDPSRLSDTIAANLQLPVDEKQDLLETVDPLERLNRIGEILEIELEKLNVDRNINTRVKRQMERAQKEYYLNEKLKAIQKELGRGEKSETDDLKKKIDSAGMPKDVHEKAVQELKRLELMPPMSAESTVSRNSRPPAHVYRRLAGPNYSNDEKSRHGEPHLRAGRSGQDVHGFPGRSLGGPDGSAGPGTQPRIHGPLSGRGIRPFQNHVRVHGERAAYHSTAAARPHGNPAPAGLHRAGKDGNRDSLLGEESAGSHGADGEEPQVYRGRFTAHYPALHA